ncbi:hypothetical protein NE575_00840 [Clostridium sp. SL.3.18]|nr:hypothetical protein [Clostridium sp. SL.3.18]
MRRRMITIILISGCMMFLATGCSKAQIIKQYDNVLQSIGEKSITKNRKLQGERKLGEDSYVGNYKADYESFSGEEIVFGGTALSRDAGNEIKVSCKIEVQSGTAKIIFQSGADDARILYDGTGEHAETIELPPASNYLKIEGKDFTGTIELDSE